MTINDEDMKPTVSIICPIRNEEKYIVESLQSLVNQTYQVDEIEILVVDGMSEDRTREIVHSFQSRFKNIKLIDNPKEIVPTALNIGIRAAHGKYILRIDGHAKAAPDYVEKCIEALEKNKADGVGGPITSVNNTETGKAITFAMSSTFGVGNSKFRTSNVECFVDSLAFPSYKQDVFKKFGFFDGPQFISKDFRDFIRLSGFTHVKTAPYHPQSNGKLERFHGTVKQEKIRKSSYVSLEDARNHIAVFIEHYNKTRLHSAIHYLTPEDVLMGRTKQRLDELKRNWI